MKLPAAWRRRLGDGPGAFLAKGAVGSLLARVVGSALLLTVQVVLARRLGAAGYGAFAYAWVWVNILALLAKLGLDTTILRFGSAYREQEQWSRVRGLLTGTSRIVLISATTLAAIALALVAWRRSHIDPELARVLAVAWLAIPFAALSGLRQASLRAFRAVVRAQLPETVLRPLFLLLLLALLWRVPIDGSAAMALNVIAVAASFGVGAFWLRRRVPDEVRQAPSETAYREWFGVAGFLLVVSLLGQLSGRVDTLLIGTWLGTREVGLYSAASRLATLLLYGLMAMNAVAAPMIAEAHAGGRHDALQRIVRLAGLGIMAFTLPLTVALLLAGRPLLALFGAEFVAAYPLLVVLALGQLVNAAAGPVGFVMSMTGYQRQLATIMAVFLGVNLTTATLLIPRLGAMGAAVATMVGMIGWNLTAAVYVYRRTGVNCFAWTGLGRGRRRGAER